MSVSIPPNTTWQAIQRRGSYSPGGMVPSVLLNGNFINYNLTGDGLPGFAQSGCGIFTSLSNKLFADTLIKNRATECKMICDTSKWNKIEFFFGDSSEYTDLY
jgi:hypothetical protein